jgi:hypothetical protein
MKQIYIRAALAVLMGSAIVAIQAGLQPHFKAGSISDLTCDFVSPPGILMASLFHDRGNASPEFRWRSRIFNALIYSGFFWLPGRRRSHL